MKSLLFSLSLIATLGACASGPAVAQASRLPNVLVIADDTDPDSIPLSNDINERVMGELRNKMRNYRVLQLDALMASAHWPALGDRISRTEKLEMAKAACKNGDTAMCPRFVVFVKTRAAVEDKRYGATAQARLSGTVVDVQNNTSMGEYQPVRMEFTAPSPCNDFCRDETIGDHAYDIAAALGEVLTNKLDASLKVSPATRTSRPDAANAEVWTDFNITFRGFSNEDILGMLRVMGKVWDGGRATVGEHSGTSQAWHQNYRSRLNNTQLQKQFTLMLSDMHLNQKQYQITTTSPRDMVIEKVLP